MASFDLVAQYIVRELINVNGGIEIPAVLDNLKINGASYIFAIDNFIDEIEATPVAEGVVNVPLYGVKYKYCFFY